MNNKQFGKLKQFQRRRKEMRRLAMVRKNAAPGPYVSNLTRAFVRYMAVLQFRYANRLDSVKRLLKKGRVSRRQRKANKLSERRALAFYRMTRASGFMLDEYETRFLTPSSIKRMMQFYRITNYELRDHDFDGFTLYVPAEHVEEVNAEVQARRCVGQRADVRPLIEIEVIAPKPEDICPVHNRLCGVNHGRPPLYFVDEAAFIPTPDNAPQAEIVTPPKHDPARYNKWES